MMSSGRDIGQRMANQNREPIDIVHSLKEARSHQKSSICLRPMWVKLKMSLMRVTKRKQMLQTVKKWRFCRWHTFLSWLTSRYFRTILTKVRSTLKYRGGIASIIEWGRKSRRIQLRNSQSMSKMKRRALEMHPCQTHPARHSSHFREDTATLICLNLLTNSSLSKTRRVAFLQPSAASITVLSAKQSRRRFQITMSLKSVSTIRTASQPIQIVHLAARTVLPTHSALWPSFLPRFQKPVPTFAS